MELTALVIVALVFFVVYRSPLLWFFPLLSAVAAIQVAQAGAHGLAHRQHAVVRYPDRAGLRRRK